MIFFPAIDLKDSQCVRLVRGDMSQATVFNGDPGGQAQIFSSAGCQWLHVVDLNGAFEGQPVNGAAVDSILETANIKIQLGGGIRSLETVAYWLERGITRVILGTSALRNPELVKEACRLYPGRVVVGIDAWEGLVAVEGWAEVSQMRVLDLALKFEDAGVSAIIYTDIGRDGAMEGPNVAATVALAEAISTPVIASGGVSSMEDLEKLKTDAPMIEGVICGRSVYDGRVDPSAAVKLLGYSC